MIRVRRQSVLVLAALTFFIAWTQSADAKQLPCKHASVAPQWAQNGVMYSIFTRNFSPDGTLSEVTKQVDRLKGLSVNILWLLPIHPIGQERRKGTLGSPYAVQNYYEIDPAYGTKKDLKTLVDKVHRVGLKIIVDAVLNHTAWDNVLIKQHPEFYRHNEEGQIIPPNPEWTDVAALDYDNPKLRAHIIEMLQYWLREFDLDGFRFDASDLVPLDFWKEVSTELHKVKKDILLLGEGEKPEALCVFNLDYDWKFKKALDTILLHGAPATATIKRTLQEEKEDFPIGSLHLRFADNHDEKRALAQYGKNASLAAHALLFTLNGLPLIYNGMEVGDLTESRDPALFEKMPIFWNSNERPQFESFYRQMISLRKSHPALRRGEIRWLKNSQEKHILTFLKTFKEETLLIAINLSNQPFSGKVGFKEPLRDLTSPSHPQNPPYLTLSPWEFRIYQVVD